MKVHSDEVSAPLPVLTMTGAMRHLVLAFALFALAVPAASLADGSPSPAAVSACQAEYQQLGADAFKAKYGATEPFGHCYAAHAGTTSQEPQSAADLCKAEYVKLGPDAFKAKYGANEPYAACLTAHGGTAPTPTPSGDDKDKPKPKSGDATDAPKNAAQLLCKAELKAAGKDAFLAKYGKEAVGQCVKATLPKARALVAACKTKSDGSRDAYKACLAAAASVAQPKRR
jgi:hypothetical protein